MRQDNQNTELFICVNGISLIGATSGPVTTYPTGAPEFTPGFQWGSCLVFCVVICGSLFFYYYIIWPSSILPLLYLQIILLTVSLVFLLSLFSDLKCYRYPFFLCSTVIGAALSTQIVILYFSVLLVIPSFYLRAFVLLLYIRNFQNDRLKDQNFQTLLQEEYELRQKFNGGL